MPLAASLEIMGAAFAGNIQIDPQIAIALRPLLMGTEQVSSGSLSAALAEAFRLHDIDYYVKDGICYVKNATDVAAGRVGLKVVDTMFPNLAELQMDW